MKGRTVTGVGESRPAVLITWPDFDSSFPAGRALLEDAGLELRLAPRLGNRTSDELGALLPGVLAAIASTDPFTAEVIAGHPELQIIARVGVGYDSVDVDAATRCGVLVATTVGANETTVADHTLALMLGAARRIAEHDRNVKEGKWLRTGPHLSWLLTGATVGLIGYGDIGRLVAERLKGFGTRILVSDPAFDGDSIAESVSLDELLIESDFVSLHVPLLPATRNLIGPREVGLMKRTAVMINTSRGGIVSESALAAALRDGMLRYAGVDVFDAEPPGASPLLELDKVVLTPHIGGVSDASVAAMVERAVHSILDVVAGEVPKDVINPAAADTWRVNREGDHV